MDRLKEEKYQVRKMVLTLLKKQEESERIAKSKVIEEELFSLPEFIQARCVMFYVSYDGEVETGAMIKRARQMGKKVAVPVIRATKGKEKQLTASLLTNGDNKLSPGYYGILQPKEEDMVEISLDPSSKRDRKAYPLGLDDIDLVVVPGVAFDRDGNRVGRGKGYYDKFLKSLREKGIPAVGIAFDFQVVDHIPTLSHDLPVEKLITA